MPGRHPTSDDVFEKQVCFQQAQQLSKFLETVKQSAMALPVNAGAKARLFAAE